MSPSSSDSETCMRRREEDANKLTCYRMPDRGTKVPFSPFEVGFSEKLIDLPTRVNTIKEERETDLNISSLSFDLASHNLISSRPQKL